MPAKGDSVNNEEIYLSSAISEMKILNHEDSICVYQEKPARNYTISAIVGDIPFTLKMIVIEGVEERPYIEKMEVIFSGIWKYELESLKSIVEKNKEPTLLLTGLRSYMNEVKYRSDVWSWMETKWSNLIENPYGHYSNCITIMSNSLNGPRILLSWTIEFSPEGIVIPTIYPHFKIHCAKESKQNDYDELNKEIIDSFLSLVDVRGVEAAVSFLMECIL